MISICDDVNDSLAHTMSFLSRLFLKTIKPSKSFVFRVIEKLAFYSAQNSRKGVGR